MQNMDELLNQIFAELSRNAYGQKKLAPETSKHCIFAVTRKNSNGYYRFLKGFYGPVDIPTIFQKKQTEHSDTKHPFG